jgi:hypothetical protein
MEVKAKLMYSHLNKKKGSNETVLLLLLNSFQFDIDMLLITVELYAYQLSLQTSRYSHPG